jgi:hypothetical protein
VPATTLGEGEALVATLEYVLPSGVLRMGVVINLGRGGDLVTEDSTWNGLELNDGNPGGSKEG